MKTQTIKNSEIKAGMHINPGRFLGVVEILEVLSVSDNKITLLMKQSTIVKNNDPFLGKIARGKSLKGTSKQYIV